MSAARYRKFFKLCEAWPLDSTKHGRDLAVVVRQRVAEAFKMGENTHIADSAKCDQDYESLRRLTTDYYKNKHKDVSPQTNTGATGLSYDECHAVMASESMEALRQTEMGLFEKLKQTFTADRPS